MKTFYEFFAGGGMARAGLGVGWKCLFANDISEKKGQSYTENWGKADLKIGDIFDLSVDDLPGNVDLAWGSFPCQDLSLAGNGAGLIGERSGAFWGYWRLMSQLKRQGRKPKMVVLENVYGTLTSHEGKDFEQIATALAKTGYRLGAIVVDAVHFCPQSRPRLFVIGIAADLIVPRELVSDVPNPAWHPDAVIRAHNRLPGNVKKNWLWWSLAMPNKPQKVLEEIIESEPQGVEWHTKIETNALLNMMSRVNLQKVVNAQHEGGLRVGTIYKRTRNNVQRAEVRFDGVAGCLRTPSGGSSRQIIMVVDGPVVRTRLISPREMARLMGLPEKYKLPEKYNDAYHLLGDGVVVPVVAHLRKCIFNPVLEANSFGQNVTTRRQA